jgi:hypothetical protein
MGFAIVTNDDLTLTWQLDFREEMIDVIKIPELPPFRVGLTANGAASKPSPRSGCNRTVFRRIVRQKMSRNFKRLL